MMPLRTPGFIRWAVPLSCVVGCVIGPVSAQTSRSATADDAESVAVSVQKALRIPPSGDPLPALASVLATPPGETEAMSQAVLKLAEDINAGADLDRLRTETTKSITVDYQSFGEAAPPYGSVSDRNEIARYMFSLSEDATRPADVRVKLSRAGLMIWVCDDYLSGWAFAQHWVRQTADAMTRLGVNQDECATLKAAIDRACNTAGRDLQALKPLWRSIDAISRTSDGVEASRRIEKSLTLLSAEQPGRDAQVGRKWNLANCFWHLRDRADRHDPALSAKVKGRITAFKDRANDDPRFRAWLQQAMEVPGKPVRLLVEEIEKDGKFERVNE